VWRAGVEREQEWTGEERRCMGMRERKRERTGGERKKEWAGEERRWPRREGKERGKGLGGERKRNKGWGDEEI
jgi:hypothetical protein